MGYYSHGRNPKGGFMSAIGKIGGAIAGFATGGIGGAIAGHKAGGAIGNALAPKRQNPVVPTKSSIAGSVGGLVRTAYGNTPLGAAVGAVANMLGPGSGGAVEMVNGQCPVGYHPNKQKGPKGEARSYCVRNRSMNAANGRAIGRATTRISKGIRMFKKSLRVMGVKHGKVVPRGRKRR